MSTLALDLAPHPLRQLAAHLRARRQPTPAWLQPDEARLFERMAPADQVEGLAVVQTLRSWGYVEDRCLLLAGLLHDVGKSLAPSHAAYRMAIAAIDRLPERLQRPWLATSQALRVLWQHSRLGAELASQECLPADVVRLIRDHHAPAHDDRMDALQRADALH